MTKILFDKAVLKQVLETLNAAHVESFLSKRTGAINLLRAALEQQKVEQEPVAWALSHSKGLEFSSKYPMQGSIEAAEQMARKHMGTVTVTPLYTHPQPKREPLTDEQINTLFQWGCGQSFRDFARAIEAAHGIKE